MKRNVSYGFTDFLCLLHQTAWSLIGEKSDKIFTLKIKSAKFTRTTEELIWLSEKKRL